MDEFVSKINTFCRAIWHEFLLQGAVMWISKFLQTHIMAGAKCA